MRNSSNHTVAALLFFLPLSALAEPRSDPPLSPSAPTVLSEGALKLSADGDALFPTAGIVAAKSNGSVTIDLSPVTAGSGGRFTLGGPLSVGFYTTLEIMGAAGCTLVAPAVTSDKPGPEIAPTTANISIASLGGRISLGGTSVGNTLGTYDGPYLQIKGGTWTVVGDNSSRAWDAGVVGGTLILAPGASLGKGSLSVKGTFAPRAGTSYAGRLNMMDGSTLDLADGAVGTFAVPGVFSGPNGGKVTLRLDVGGEGVDRLILSETSTTNDIRDYVDLRLLETPPKPGTYVILALSNPAQNIVENHLGFDFTGDPANHDNIVKTKTVGSWRFTLDTLDASGNPSHYTGNYSVYTLKIEPASP